MGILLAMRESGQEDSSDVPALSREEGSCIGIGNDAGWEFLSLAKEPEWMPEQQGFNAVRPGQSGVRFVQIRYRKIKKI